MNFRFNKKAQARTLKLLKHVETLSFACAVGGAFTDDPRVIALVAACTYVVANLLAIIVTCIEVENPPTRTRRTTTTRKRGQPGIKGDQHRSGSRSNDEPN